MNKIINKIRFSLTAISRIISSDAIYLTSFRVEERTQEGLGIGMTSDTYGVKKEWHDQIDGVIKSILSRQSSQ